MADKKNGGPPKKARQEYIGARQQKENTDFAWWRLEGGQAADSIQAVVNTVTQNQTYQRTLELKYARLYSNLEIFGLGYGSYNVSTPSTVQTNAITYNVVKSVIDAATAKIAKNRPRPLFLTSGGNHDQQERAKKLTKYIDGIFYDTGVYAKAQKSFLDACVFGTGVLKLMVKDGRIAIERVIPTELVVDDADGRYGSPQQIHQIRLVSRDSLLQAYPEHREAILSAPSGLSTTTSTSNVADMVSVTESWHLNMRHVISIDGAALFEEDYDKDYFPFVFYRWDERLAGFMGQGIAENIVGVQIEINKILRTIQKAQNLAAIPRIFLDNASKVSPAQMNNQVGAIIKYTGTKPSFETANAMNAESYNHMKWLIQSAYELTGISQLTAQSQKPSGLDSGVALREFNDIETERFMINGQRYEKLFLDISTMAIDMSRDIYAADPSLTVNVIGGDFIESIKWKDVDLADDVFIMKVYPANLLPTTPAGRMQKVQEMIKSGMISPEEGKDLLDFPDFEAHQTLSSADTNLTKKMVSLITEKGEYNPPEPEQNLAFAATYAQQAYLQGLIDSLPESRLELLQRYMDDARRLEALGTEPVAEALPAAPVGPQAVPEPLEQSELIPNVEPIV